MFARVMKFVIPSLAGLSLTFFLAAANDLFQLYRVWPDIAGREDWRAVLSSTFFSSLPWAAIAGFGIVIILWLYTAVKLARDRSISFVTALERDALAWAPMLVGLLLPLRYLHGIATSGAGPYLFLSTLAGPIFFVAVVLTIRTKFRLFVSPEDEARPFLDGHSDRAIGWFVALAVFLLIGALAVYYAFVAPFGGDQPHYLIVTHSLIEDGDVFIGDDHAAKAYRAFTEHEIAPQYYRRTLDGKIIPAHKFGLSILAVPAYLALGKLGALLLIALFAALCAAGTYWLTMKFVPDRRAALLATLWVVFSVPALPMSVLFFTEIPSALFLLAALNLIIQPPDKKAVRWPWLVPFIIWFMPWLHVRNFVVAFFLSGLMIWRLRKRPWTASALALVCILFSLGIPFFNLLMYGDLSPVAELGGLQGKDLAFLNIFQSISGLIFDQEFGVLLYNPLIVAALIGLWSLWQRNRSAAVLLLVLTALSLGPMTLYQMWWGGGSPPARYLAANIHLAAIPLAALIAARRHKRGAGAIALFLAIGIAVGLALIADPFTLSNNRDGSANLLSSVSLGTLDAVEWWPSWIAGGMRAWPLAGLLIVWTGVTAGLLWFVRWLFRHAHLGPGTLTILLLAVIAAWGYTVTAEILTPDEPNGMQPTSHLLDGALQFRMREGVAAIIPILPAYTDPVPPARRFSAELLFGQENLTPDALAPRGRSLSLRERDTLPIVTAHPLYAGTSTLILGMRAEGGPAEVVCGVYSSSGEEGRHERLAIGKVTIPADRFVDISIPCTMRLNYQGLAVYFTGNRPLRFIYAVVSPKLLITKASWQGYPAAFNHVAWRIGGFDLFTDPDDIYPPEQDGFWTHSDRSFSWYLGSGQPLDQIALTLRGGPGAWVELRSGGKTEKVAFGFKARSRTLTMSLAAEEYKGIWYAPLTLTVHGAFVPARVDPGSTDERPLGVFFQFAAGSR